MNVHFKQSDLHKITSGQAILETEMDSYKVSANLDEPMHCADCGAVYHAGFWQWLAKPAEAQQTICPACSRIRKNLAEGYVALSGEFFSANEREILRLIKDYEMRGREAQPLLRIMAVKKTEFGALITTTDSNLARGIGEALQQTFKGVLEFHGTPDNNLLGVSWNR